MFSQSTTTNHHLSSKHPDTSARGAARFQLMPHPIITQSNSGDTRTAGVFIEGLTQERQRKQTMVNNFTNLAAAAVGVE